MRKKRTDEDYELRSVTKAIKVLEALEGRNFEPVTVAKIMERTRLSRHIVEWNLKTFRLHGWVAQNERGEWTIGSRFVRFAISAKNSKEPI